MTRSQRRKRASEAFVALLALLAAAALFTPAAATEPSSPPAGVSFVGAWTNDDGTLDGPDVNDDGGPVTAYDAWGTLSSADPSVPGMDSPRFDKDAARCTATVEGDAATIDVDVAAGYPGYTCTFGVVMRNDTGLPADAAPPVLTVDDGLTVGVLAAPPTVLDFGEEAETLLWVRVEQSAPQHATLHFTITIGAAGQACEPLAQGDIPPGTGLINASGQCKYFYDAKPGPCGPGWTTEEPYAWHFVVKKTGGVVTGTVTGLFASAGWLATDTPTEVHSKNLHFYLYTPTPDTLVGAYLEGIPGAKLVLSHTCNDPDGSGHVR